MTNDAYQNGYNDGYRDALAQLMTADEAAAKLNTTRHRLHQYAKEINAGARIGNRTIVFTPADLERLRIRQSMDLRLWRKEHGQTS